MEFIIIRILNKLEFIRIPLGNGINRKAGDPGWRPGLLPREVPRSETSRWLNTPYQERPTPAHSQWIPFVILRPDPELILWRFSQQRECSKLSLGHRPVPCLQKNRGTPPPEALGVGICAFWWFQPELSLICVGEKFCTWCLLKTARQVLFELLQ